MRAEQVYRETRKANILTAPGPDPPQKTATKMCERVRDIVIAALTRFTPPPRTGPYPEEESRGGMLLIAWPNP